MRDCQPGCGTCGASSPWRWRIGPATTRWARNSPRVCHADRGAFWSDFLGRTRSSGAGGRAWPTTIWFSGWDCGGGGSGSDHSSARTERSCWRQHGRARSSGLGAGGGTAHRKTDIFLQTDKTNRTEQETRISIRLQHQTAIHAIHHCRHEHELL